MAETILTEQMLDFTLDEDYGRHVCHINPAPFVLVENYTYDVTWDTKLYRCTAQEYVGADGTLLLGNTTGDEDKEPFLINWSSSGVTYFSMDDEATHSVAIVEQGIGLILKNRSGDDKTYYGRETVSFNSTIDGEKICFHRGNKVEREVSLNMVDGNQVIEADKDELLTKITIIKPDSLIPENIKVNEVIGGIEGSLEAPQLYAPTGISRGTNSSTKLQYFNVTNPYTSNGRFPTKVQIMATVDGESTVVGELALSTTSYTSTASVYANSFLRPLSSVTVQARFVGNNFKPSEIYSGYTTYSVTKIIHNLISASVSTLNNYLFKGDIATVTITPEENYYLPKTISLVASSGEVPTYTYDPDTGIFVLTLDIDTEELSINVETVEVPWLRNPLLTVDSNLLLTVNFVDSNAEANTVFSNGTALLNVEDTRTGLIEYSVVNYASSSGSMSISGTTYTLKTTSSYGYQIVTINFNMKTAATVNLYVYNYNYSASYDTYYTTVVSKVDTTLAASYSSDYSTGTNILWSSYDKNTSNTSTTLSISIPSGKHTVQVKYTARGGSYYSNCYGQFRVTTSVAAAVTYDLREYFDGYGTYALQAQSFAKGYTDSDLLDIKTVVYAPVISISSGILTISDIISSVVSYAVMVDNVEIGVYETTGESSYQLDLLQFAFEIGQHSVQVIATLDNGETVVSNIIDNKPIFTYATFADATWDEINTVSTCGMAAACYAVGNTKTIAFSSTTITVAIAGFNHDDLADGSGKAGISIVCMSVPAITTVWASSYSYSYLYTQGYNKVRSTLNSWLSSLPAELTAVIKAVTKVSDANDDSGSTDVTYSSETLWALSLMELGCEVSNSNTVPLGSRYALFPARTSNASLPTVTTTTTTTKVNYWTRQSNRLGTACGTYITTSGTYSWKTGSSVTSTYYYIRFGFCV